MRRRHQPHARHGRTLAGPEPKQSDRILQRFAARQCYSENVKSTVKSGSNFDAVLRRCRAGVVAMWVDEFAILHRNSTLLHSDAPGIERAAQWSGKFARTVVLDLSRVSETSTDAFADLILIRRRLLRRGRDLRLTNLRDRPARLYEITRLREILPLR